MAAAESPVTESVGLERESSEGSTGEERSVFEYGGWVYHLGVNSIGHEYCHLRFLLIRGKYVQMFKREPHEHLDIKPIRKGVVGPTLMVEDLGCRKFNDKDLYVLRFFNRLDESKKGEIACPNAGETRKWMEAFDHAKQQAEYELTRGGSSRNKLITEDDCSLVESPNSRDYGNAVGLVAAFSVTSRKNVSINLDGHRPRVRRYAHELRKFIRIGQGPEMLLRQSSGLPADASSDMYFGKDVDGDAIEAHQWKCVRTINGVRIFEDISDSQRGKGVLVKAAAVVDASADTVFEVILNLDRQKRYEWDILTGDLEQVDLQDGHYDVVYGTFDPKYLTRWHSKRDFLFSRQWFRGQDGTYTILQLPAVNKKKPPRSGYRRVKINPSTWEIRNLHTPMGLNSPKCLVMQMLEIQSSGWFRWKKSHSTKFEKSVPYALLSQVAGLKEYISANPSLTLESATTVVKSKFAHVSIPNGHNEETETQDEFYDAIAGDSSSSSSDEESDDGELNKKDAKVKLRNVSWAITSLALKRTSGISKEFDPDLSSIIVDPSQFSSSLHKGKDENDTNCWASPSGSGFMIRGKTYLRDNSKVMGGDPLLKLIAVDWYKVDETVDRIALHPKSLVQSEAGKKLPFVLVINLQVPAKPNYSLVLYYAAERPLRKNSLLAKFADGSDMFRDARFKLIPSIVEGYWMVKRAVGTKACLLGKAVSCKYFRQDNFLEIDVDIGSSSVARSVIGLVLGYVTSLVVDLAILIEAKEEEELPEYILGTVRLNRVKLDSAVPLDD